MDIVMLVLTGPIPKKLIGVVNGRKEVILRVNQAVIELIAYRLEHWILYYDNPPTSSLHTNWFVINSQTSDPEVGWPGDMVAGPFDTKEEARLAMAKHLLDFVSVNMPEE